MEFGPIQSLRGFSVAKAREAPTAPDTRARDLAAADAERFDRVSLCWHGGGGYGDRFSIQGSDQRQSTRSDVASFAVPRRETVPSFVAAATRASASAEDRPATDAGVGPMRMPASLAAPALSHRAASGAVTSDGAPTPVPFVVGERASLRAAGRQTTTARPTAQPQRTEERRRPSATERAPMPVAKQVVLVCHGATTDADDGAAGLSAMGKAQAAWTADFLTRFVQHAPIVTRHRLSGFVASPARCAIATAEIIWDGLRDAGLTRSVDRRLDDRVADIDEAELNAATPSDRARALVDAADSVLSPFVTDAGPDADESGGGVEIFVGHSAPWRFVLCRALDLPPRAAATMSFGHCSVAVITVPAEGRPVVAMMGSQGHLPPDHMTAVP